MKVYWLTFSTVFFICSALVLFISCKKSSVTDENNGGSNPDVQVITNVTYGSNKDLSGKTVNLALDIYMPQGATSAQKFPFILFVHGGGFIAGDKNSAIAVMEKFVKAGYVAVSIDYRLDSSLDGVKDACSIDSSVMQKAVYMAVQDTRAAMGFMVANADNYHIDISKIFLNGNSAGTITVLYSHFLTQDDFNEMMPGVETELGGINNSGNSLTNTFNIIGMAANSGCLPGIQYIKSSNAIPLIFFHGGKDSVIPVIHGTANYCPIAMDVFGSMAMYNRLSELGEPAVVHIDPEGGHGPFNEDFLTNNEVCFFNSVLGKKTTSGIYSGQQSSCP
jgi:acetyl esterase/lipase